MSSRTRVERLALNESAFREINDRVTRDLAPLRHPPARMAFVCECARLECRDQIELSRAEYERVRAEAMDFVIAPGHEFPEAEDVVERTERFSVVRKHADVGHIATSTDPRGPAARAPREDA
jgi:hypothetical protein